jgi:hypothetical protein
MAPDGFAAPGGHLQEALAAIDEAAAQQPKLDGAQFSRATLHLSAERDAMAAAQRADNGIDMFQAPAESRRRLEHINAIISVVLACHFPLGAIPWHELEKARAWLADLANDAAP